MAKMPGRLVIICGLPGSGKTTLARGLERARPGVRLCPDEWMEQLSVDLFDSDARGRVERMQWQLAQRLLELGLTVLIEWGHGAATSATCCAWERERSARPSSYSCSILRSPCCGSAFVSATWSVACKHELTRDELARWSAAFQRPDANELALYDPPP
jgi:hypothetical protein